MPAQKVLAGGDEAQLSRAVRIVTALAEAGLDPNDQSVRLAAATTLQVIADEMAGKVVAPEATVQQTAAAPIPVARAESAFAIALNNHPLSIASARQQSHDTVIANAGTDRRSGVVWHSFDVRTALDDLAASTDIVVPLDVLAEMAMYPDGILVVATVEVEA